MKTTTRIASLICSTKKFLPVLLLVASAGSLLLLSTCKKHADEENTTKAYSNMKDDSTRAIRVSIPRIEIAKTKSAKITIFLSVTDQNGNPFTEFNQYNFNVRQVCDGNTDTTLIASITFTHADVEGYDVASALTMDFSGSMAGLATRNMQAAAKQFVRLKKEQDACEIIKFDDQIEVTQPFTNDTAALVTAIDQKYGGGLTAFYDATYTAITDASGYLTSHSQMFPVVITFTDGQDNMSTYADLLSCIALANNKQIPIYTIGYRNTVDSVSLQTLAYQTGGMYYFTPDSETLSQFYSQISRQLKNEYMLSWEYDNPACQKVWVFVTATYTCATGTYVAKAEKYFFPVKK